MSIYHVTRVSLRVLPDNVPSLPELDRRTKILTICMALLALGELAQAIILEALIRNLT